MEIQRLRPIAWLAVSACALALCGDGARAGVAITDLVVDGQPMSLEGASSSTSGRNSEMKPIRVSSPRSLQFRFFQDDNSRRPATILRYKLEGYDNDWRDLPTKMRVMLYFYDSYMKFVGSEEFPFEGETPGWRGTLKNSDYVTMQWRVVVPERAARMKVYIATAGNDSDLGWVGIDAVRGVIEHPGDSQPSSFDLSIQAGGSLHTPSGRPANWERDGPGSELAQLKSRLTPERHPMLVLLDDDPQRYAAWRTTSSLTVSPGDRVTLQWETAHSIGNAGPGTASYEDLPPGNYWFRVAAFTVNGQGTGIETTMQVVVVPPFYHRSEFWLAVSLATAAGAAWVGRGMMRRRMQAKIDRIERERSLERERARIARDLHDEIGAGLTEIAMQTDLVRHDLAQRNTSETLRRAGRVCESAMEMVRRVDEIVWAVNPANDTVDRFVSYLTQYTEHFVDAAGLRLRFDIFDDLPVMPISGTLRHAIFLAVSESLNNVVKHAGADLLRMKIDVAEGWLWIVVEDNGRGFDMTAFTANGIQEGLSNMRRRIEQWGGEFRLVSQVDAGTQVEFKIPLSGSPAVPQPAE